MTDQHPFLIRRELVELVFVVVHVLLFVLEISDEKSARGHFSARQTWHEEPAGCNRRTSHLLVATAVILKLFEHFLENRHGKQAVLVVPEEKPEKQFFLMRGTTYLRPFPNLAKNIGKYLDDLGATYSVNFSYLFSQSSTLSLQSHHWHSAKTFKTTAR